MLKTTKDIAAHFKQTNDARRISIKLSKQISSLSLQNLNTHSASSSAIQRPLIKVELLEDTDDGKETLENTDSQGGADTFAQTQSSNLMPKRSNTYFALRK